VTFRGSRSDLGDRWLDEIAASAAPSHSRIWDSYPKVRFAPDSPLEGDGFEPSVPRQGSCGSETASVSGRKGTAPPLMGCATKVGSHGDSLVEGFEPSVPRQSHNSLDAAVS
jgi:hypothetical protein